MQIRVKLGNGENQARRAAKPRPRPGLTADMVRLAKAPPYPEKTTWHCDSGGLYLRRRPNGALHWFFRYSRGGAAHWHALGDARRMTLSEARERAARAARRVHDGESPMAAARSAATGTTFAACAAEFVATRGATWPAKRRQQFEQSLRSHTRAIARLPVAKITTNDVLAALEPIWTVKHVTARRVRGRIERVLSYARVRGYRGDGANAAAWRGNLQECLADTPDARRERPPRHHTAMAFADVPGFVSELGALDTPDARALAFLILTATRTDETRRATWREFDLIARIWRIPAERMKAGRAHAVPLSIAAMHILKALPGERRPDGFVFLSERYAYTVGRPISNNSMLMLLQTKMLRTGMTVHGFRTAFREWAEKHARKIADWPAREFALAHVVRGATEAAYNRTDYLDERRPLMEAWGRFCTSGQAGKQT